jgi:hypothetical protein
MALPSHLGTRRWGCAQTGGCKSRRKFVKWLCHRIWERGGEVERELVDAKAETIIKRLRHHTWERGGGVVRELVDGKAKQKSGGRRMDKQPKKKGRVDWLRAAWISRRVPSGRVGK